MLNNMHYATFNRLMLVLLNNIGQYIDRKAVMCVMPQYTTDKEKRTRTYLGFLLQYR